MNGINDMMKLSTGQDSTLESYLQLCNLFFGEDSAQSKFIQSKIDESPNGLKEEVIAEESQMLFLLGNM
jgi:hypothetical protein